ncbi:Protein of unknown function [Arcanobacterium phocae]|uniref:Uncharacterized protein n=1 Tax=Arcanobacterium phocae TaxID=131112 RepID=A0A1H2LCS9_9ACTO|nr:DUF3644 domain-containing protein [Arcanobacterium phocae]SDU78236.1 Protein of unknown function [Arcanobacterium phocae]
MCLDLQNELLDKSQELFTLAVELYNRPTIKYHAEGCAIFLCSAWELMLKAEICKRSGNKALFYSGTGRTLSLSDCLKKIFTNENDPLRKNMDKVIELRNTSTHFITMEYEIFYGPILQACVSNYAEKIEELHGRCMSDIMPENYLNLSVNRTVVDEDKVRAKYSPEIAEKLLLQYNSITQDIGEGNERYASFYQTNLIVVKNPKKADLAVRLYSESEAGLAIGKQLINPSEKYIYTYNKACHAISKRIRKSDIIFLYKGKPQDRFNSFHFKQFVDFYDMKNDLRFAFNRATRGEEPAYIYSEQVIQFVVEEIRKNPKIIDLLVNKQNKRNDPQEQGNSQ